MNYELAKELKDAGFKQNGVGDYWHANPTPYFKENRLAQYANPKDLLDQYVYIPTLSELIEACGDGFDALLLQKTERQKFADGKQWVAMESRFSGGVEDLPRGSTPEEAVARLWLALNKTI